MADTKISALSAVTDVIGTDEYVLARSGTTKKIDASDLMAGFGGVILFSSYALYRDEKSAGTSGGSFTSGSWQTRTLNTEKFDPDGIGALSSNQVTLGVGTFWLEARAPVYATGNNSPLIQLRIRNITDSTTIATGSAHVPGSATGTVNDSAMSFASGRLVIASSTKAIEVQHRTDITLATNGFGIAGNFGETEVYAELLIYKEA